MTPKEFKKRWNSPNGGGITFNDIAECAKSWRLYNNPKTAPIYEVANKVLLHAGCKKHFDES